MKASQYQAPIPMFLNERTLPKYHLRHDVLLDCLCHLYGDEFFDIFHDWIRLGKVRAIKMWLDQGQAAVLVSGRSFPACMVRVS